MLISDWSSDVCSSDLADLLRLGGDDIVARERELEAAAKTDAMNACDDRDREQFERAQKLDRRRMARGVACGLFGALLPLGPRIEEVEVRARGKVAKTAAQHDSPAARLQRRGEFGTQHPHQLWYDEIIGPTIGRAHVRPPVT